MVKFPFSSVCFLALVACASAAHAEDGNLPSQIQSWLGNTDPNNETTSIHGQATEIIQGYPAFDAPYSGAHSLSLQPQTRNTTTGTLFLGTRLWQGAEVYYNPELYEGVGLSRGEGTAGFPNGDATRAGDYGFTTGDARIFLRQVIGLGGPTEQIAAGQNQLATTEDVSRITLTVGKFSPTDIFDNNAYSHDPRSQFMNWSLMDSAAWDYPSNGRGYADGFAIELNQEKWALRYGAFLMTKIGNLDTMPMRGFDNLGQVAELEERYTIDNNPGKLHFMVFLNRDGAGNFQDALALGGNINDAMASVEQYGAIKYGFAINAEQQLTDSLGAFVRLSWDNGKTEDIDFTQVDESLAVGLSMSGKKWNRPDDTWGIAAVVNGLSADQKKYVEAGGEGLAIGDGQLNYKPEMIMETYYSWQITSAVAISPDYQFVANPGYNSDRGPVHIFAARVHIAF